MTKSIIKNKKQIYQSPEVEVFIFKMEAGFAASGGGGTSLDMSIKSLGGSGF